jgi:eukaryotic-like serine/threonine-protein kinase
MVDHRYRVIKRLEAGGMAEVYLGEATGVEGFKKRVAIKRVLPHLAQNENFIRMFLDEARLSARLNHANIVSVFDISARDDTYFLIMEFVDGANLKKIQESLQRRGQRFALPEAVYVCAEACRGLSYAHELHDENGRPLGIVHRDVSPPNILLTKLGEVKVADFGLAKAGTQLSQTDPGVVKGKFSYLSPEAANGKEVDARADIFSLGIVLWEMLAGRRLFLGETDYATVKLVQQANIPRLSPLNNQVDLDFEEIMLKALARDPDQRFQSEHDLGEALTGYLFHRQLKVTNNNIANVVKSAIAEDLLPTKSETSLIDRLIQEELDMSVGLGGKAEKPRATPISGLGELEPEGELEDPMQWFTEEPEAPKRASRRPPDPKRGNTGWRETGLESADHDDIDDDETGQHQIAGGSIQPFSLEPDPPSKPPSSGPSSQPQAQQMAATAGASAVAKRPALTGKYVIMAMAVLVMLVVAIALLGRYTF